MDKKSGASTKSKNKGTGNGAKESTAAPVKVNGRRTRSKSKSILDDAKKAKDATADQRFVKATTDQFSPPKPRAATSKCTQEKDGANVTSTRKRKRPPRKSVVFSPAPEPCDLAQPQQPTPKRQRTRSSKISSSAKATSVTPSPGQKAWQPPPPPSSWLAYDELLKGDKRAPPSTFIDDWHHVNRSTDIREWNLRAAVDKLLKDPLFSKSYGIKAGAHFLYKWRRYAMTVSSYPKDRLKAVKEEFVKDRKLHADLLNGLTKEISERRFGGKRFYLRALNCMFYDAFARCGIPHPPLVYYDLAMDPNLTRKEVYHKQLRVWNACKTRAFAVLAIAAECPLPAKEGEERGDDLVLITPLQHRGDMPPMKKECMNEVQVIKYNWDWDKKKKKSSSTSSTSTNAAEEAEKKEDDWNISVCFCTDCIAKFKSAKATKQEWDEIYKSDDDDDDDDDHLSARSGTSPNSKAEGQASDCRPEESEEDDHQSYSSNESSQSDSCRQWPFS